MWRSGPDEVAMHTVYGREMPSHCSLYFPATQATRRPDRVLGGLAKQVGVNMDQYEACVSSQKYQPQIRANVEEGVKRGVNGTPTFFIGSKSIAHPIPYDEFKKYVDEALAQVRATKTTK